MTKTSFIAWTHFHRRSEILATHFGASLHYVTWGPRSRSYLSPLRYAAQAWRTWRILAAERPDVVLVQNPPIFAVLAVSIYARRRGARYIIDSHSGAFLSPRWRWSLGLHRRLSSAALTTLVHNQSQAALLANWRCCYHVVGFTPGDYRTGATYPLNGRFSVAVISTFEADEPLAVVFEAASALPDVDFYVTGDSGRLAQVLLKQKSDNCHLTGYLSYERYVGLLRGADIVMDLTARDHTLLMGGFEAVSLGKPLIVSDWPVLRDYFCMGAVHVRNTPQDLCAGVRRAQAEQARLQKDVLILRERLTAEWERNLAALQGLLQESDRLLT